ncbi:MarR family winged helix-turn-helix transcriptional regulator [Agromyces albus]|uniref:MarR family winged helix-turn-helix transcriptional regulator n=1 Tax=Agromyces albus TaxID=205332 RepID=UPI00277E026D|nr:MarR family winged helix-turn-helix transcriptional regulator [Agromyces albus]MDQ0576520.1 DNA-binding MarR family transcriptional regulator [Agromyces albus]
MPPSASDSAVPDPRLADSALADDPIFLLARASALAIAAGNASLAEHGLKARSYAVLALAASDAGPTQRELAEFLRLDPSQVVALVDGLQARGLVRREPDPSDRRANVVVITDDGRDLFARARISAYAVEQQLHSALGDESRERVMELLRALAFPE